MKKSKKNDDGYYALAGVISVLLTIGIHYFFISNINLNSTIYVIISLSIFFLLASTISPLLAKFWNKF